jgi:uncharacterized protein
MNRKVLAALFIVLVLLCGTITSCSRKPVPNPQATEQAKCSLPFPKSAVSDFANVLDQDSKEQLEEKLRGLKERGEIDFAIAIIDSTGGQLIFDYSLELARCWGVGARNLDKAGLLLVVAIKDRKWHMQISKSIEKNLSNDEVSDLGNLMTEPFRIGSYAEGINKCVDATIDVLAKRRGFSKSNI